MSYIKDSVILTLTLGKPSSMRRADRNKFKYDADDDVVYLSKRILRCIELKDVSTQDREIKRFLNTWANKGKTALLRKGCWIVRNKNITRIDDRLRSMLDERKRLVNQFIKVYPKRIIDDKRKLRELWRKEDYPHIETVKAAFHASYHFLTPFDMPKELKRFSKDVFRREEEKVRAFWDQAMTDVDRALTSGFKQLINSAVEKLTPGRDGQKKAIASTFTGKIDEFIDAFKDKNLTNNKELADLVEKARRVLKGVDGIAIREEDSLRENVAKQFKDIDKKLDIMLVKKPKRRIILRD